MRIQAPFISGHITAGAGWVRIFGHGFAWKDTRRFRLLFSERNGYTKHIMFRHWSIKWIKKLESDG